MLNFTFLCEYAQSAEQLEINNYRLLRIFAIVYIFDGEASCHYQNVKCSVILVLRVYGSVYYYNRCRIIEITVLNLDRARISKFSEIIQVVETRRFRVALFNILHKFEIILVEHKMQSQKMNRAFDEEAELNEEIMQVQRQIQLLMKIEAEQKAELERIAEQRKIVAAKYAKEQQKRELLKKWSVKIVDKIISNFNSINSCKLY